MPTNIDIKDAGLAAAMKLGPFKTKRDAMVAGLKLLACRRTTARFCAGRASCNGTLTPLPAPTPQTQTPARPRWAQHPRRCCLPEHWPRQAPCSRDLARKRRAAGRRRRRPDRFFNGEAAPARDNLHQLLAQGVIEIIEPDLMLFEISRGFRQRRHDLQAESRRFGLDVKSTGGAGTQSRATLPQPAGGRHHGTQRGGCAGRGVLRSPRLRPAASRP